jgi:hypothetical protein
MYTKCITNAGPIWELINLTYIRYCQFLYQVHFIFIYNVVIKDYRWADAKEFLLGRHVRDRSLLPATF